MASEGRVMMNRTLGRDRIWDQAIWDEIDKAVKDEMDRVRVVRKVFPVRHPSAGPAGTDVIPSGRIRDMRIPDGETKRMVEISVGFSLSQTQAEGEATLRTARILARVAAKFLALAEDSLLLHGAGSRYLTAPGARAKVPDDLASLARNGLVEAAPEGIAVNPKDATGGYGERTFQAVAEGIAHLIEKGEPAPYALFLATEVYADAHAPIKDSLATTASRIIPLVQGGCHATGALNRGRGLLVSLAGESTAIYEAQEAVTAYLHDHDDGRHRFKVFERVQYVERDVDAFVRLEFAPAPVPREQTLPGSGTAGSATPRSGDREAAGTT
jgi:uncharacterized linocin/CFP29 family protein